MKTALTSFNAKDRRRICLLREERENEERLKREMMKKVEQVRGLKENSPVFVTIDGKTVSGYIIKKVDDYVYDIKTPYGVLEGVNSFEKGVEVRGRLVEKLDDVVIPEELKKCSTGELLRMLGFYRKGGHSDYWGTPQFSEREIKAELRNRPHIPTKREKKIFQRYKDKKKKS
jgi:hypothetical protein